MPNWMDQWLIFAGVMALGQFSPGPDMLLLTRTALASSRLAGCVTALGIVCGLAIHAAIAVAGVATILSQGGWWVTLLKCAAAIYLLWLGGNMIWHGLKLKKLQIIEGHGSEGLLACWKRGLFCNLLNPKVAIFLAGVTAPFLVIPDAPSGWPLILWMTMVLEGLLLWCLWVCALQFPVFKKRYTQFAHWFDVSFGIVLCVIAGMLVFRN